jgi:hypothetical protein
LVQLTWLNGRTRHESVCAYRERNRRRRIRSPSRRFGKVGSTYREEIEERPPKQLKEAEVRQSAEAGIFQREKIKLLLQHKFPADRLHSLIATTAVTLNIVEDMEKETNRCAEDEEMLVKEQRLLIKGIALFTEVLKEHYIPALYVVSQYARNMFESNKKEITREEYANTATELNRPTTERREVWTVAIAETEKALSAMKSGDLTEDKTQALKAHINALRSQKLLLE